MFKFMKINFLILINTIKNSFLSLAAYRIQTVSKLVYSILLFFIQVFVWESIYKTGNISHLNNEIEINEMIIYCLLSSCISVFVNFEASPILTIGDKIISGQIATDLIKPISLKTYLFSEYIGSTIYRLIFTLIPLLICINAFLDLSINFKVHNIIFFLFAVVNASLLYFFLSYTVGLLSFWYGNLGNLNILVDSSITLFSGSIIPLWFLPKKILFIFNFFPFKLLYFSPISIILNKVNITTSIIIIIQQYLWIIFFILASKKIYNKGIKKISIQGG
jgi:ABC-2 type transport system permease protein